MTKRDVVVMLAYYFPPLAGIASDRSAAVAGLLPSTGWDPIVVTARSGFYHRSSDAYAAPFPVLRTRDVELSRFLRAVYSRGRGLEALDSTTVDPISAGRLGVGFRRLLREYIYVPDAQLGWIPAAARSAVGAVSEASGSVVLWSSSVPYSAHLAAMYTARRTGAKWVAEFRDPWTTQHPDNLPRSGLRRALNLRIERQIVNSADHVVVLSESTRETILAQHRSLPPERVSVITNGFVPLEAGPPPQPEAKMSILYAGTVARGEDPSLVLAALDTLHREQPGSFVLRILGPAAPWRVSSARERPWLELPGMVSAAQAHQEMRQSSALLVLQRHPAYRIVLPGKSFEYIGARRPIIAAVPQHWELMRLLERHADVRRVDPLTPDAFAAIARTLLEEHRAGSIQDPRVPEDLVAPLQRSEQVRRLGAIFDELSGRTP